MMNKTLINNGLTILVDISINALLRRELNI